MVSVLAFYSDYPSLNPADAYLQFFVKLVLEKHGNEQKEAGVGQFFKKSFQQLQQKFFFVVVVSQNHNYASDPTEWPFLTRGIAYFIAKDSNVKFST